MTFDENALGRVILAFLDRALCASMQSPHLKCAILNAHWDTQPDWPYKAYGKKESTPSQAQVSE